jgi:hypothetical protein
MNEDEILRMVRALEEIREGQKLQLDRQQQALAQLPQFRGVIYGRSMG